MMPQENYKKLSCVDCMSGMGLDFEITMAFQPIVNINTQQIFAHEALVRGIHNEIVKGIIQVCQELSIQVLGEGVETYEEMATLKEFGVELFQGFYFAKPAFRALASVPQERYDTH